MHRKTPADTPPHRNGNADPPRLYNSREVRELLGGISVRSFRRLTSSGALKAIKQGAYVYVSEDALNAYITGLPELTADAPTEAGVST